MTWAAIAVGGLTAVGGAYSADKASDAQDAAGKRALRLTKQQQALNAPWMERGNQAANFLQTLMGLSGGEGSTYESLYEQFLPQFVKYKKIDDGDGFKSAVKSFGKNALTGGLVGPSKGELKDMEKYTIHGALGRSKLNKPGYQTIFGKKQQAELDEFVKNKLAEYEKNRSNPMYGSLMKNFDNSMFQKDPGYDFRQQQGNQGIQSSLAAKGGLFSGAAGKALARYNQDFASNEFGQAANRYDQNRMNVFNMLSGIAGTGQAAQQFGAGLSGQMGNLLTDLGANRASGYVGMGNAFNQGLGTGANYWQQQMALKKIPGIANAT